MGPRAEKQKKINFYKQTTKFRKKFVNITKETKILCIIRLINIFKFNKKELVELI